MKGADSPKTYGNLIQQMLSMESNEREHDLETKANEEKVNKNGEIADANDTSEKCLKKEKLKSWLNRHLRIKMTDGRILTGAFLCTDRDANVILGLCSEYLSENSEARALGLVMVPGRHIVTIHLDACK